MKKKGFLVGVSALALAGLSTALTSCGKTATYTVKFYDGTTEYDSKTVTSGYNVEVPKAPTSDGKIFNGWYSDESLTTPFDFGSIVEKDTQVYAAWVNKYSVTFKDGETVLKTDTVTSGENVKFPEVPTKTDKAFNGWYTDKDFKKPYDFGSVVTADTTLYASFVSATDPKEEFRVTYMVNGEVVGTDLTFHQKLETLEEATAQGKTFAGWWVSDYQDSSRLTYKFDMSMELTQDVILFAVFNDASVPLVSVDNNEISWDSKGVSKEYAVNIKNADSIDADAIYTRRISTTSLAYNFDELEAGNYIIEVTCGDYTGRAYFSNKALDRVNLFVEDYELVWNKVEGATNYKISIDNGIKANQVKKLDLGDVNSYDFSTVPMTANGIKFTVVAEAEGKLSSTKEYNLVRVLPELKNVSVNEAADKLTWDAVEGATQYKVQVTVDDVTKTYYVNDTEFSFANFTGNISYSVSQYADGYYSYSKTGSHTKTILAAPKNIQLTADGYSITWDAVEGAVSYNVKIGNETKSVNTNTYVLTAEEKELQGLTVQVQAVAANEANNSAYTQDVDFGVGEVNYVLFSEGVISWNPVLGVTKYAVVIDGDEAIITTGTSLKVKLESGQHVFKVVKADSEGNYNIADAVDLDVTVYNLNFVTNGADEIESIPYLVGEEIHLPTVVYPGYTFTGWYKEEGNYVTNEFTETYFDKNEDITIYAGWQGNHYTATLDYAVYGQGDVTEVEMTFGSTFTLPVPTTDEPLKAFGGWYAELNGEGEKYTDEFGNALRGWRDYQDVTLYAGWLDVFEFNEIDNGEAYSVTKGRGIDLVTTVTIPDVYNGKPVTTVEASAFESCKNLTEVNIPNTIQNIEVGKEGPNGSGNCFQGCSSLERVNIYEVEGAVEENIKYISIDGILIYKNEMTNNVELAYIPYYTKAGIYTVPSIVTSIPQKTFKSCSKLEEIVIPSSVIYVGEEAFASCSKLTKITFLAAEEGVEEKELNLGNKAFSSNSSLEELNIPSRISQFNADMISSCSKLTAINIVGNYKDAKYTSIDGVVLNNTKTEIIFCPRGKVGEYRTPVGVTKIAQSAFTSCSKLTALTISGQVSEIGKEAFKSCSGLTSLIFEGVSDDAPLTIRESAFYGCTYITEVILPANLVVMEVNAFGGTTRLVDVTVLSSSADINFATNAFGTTAASPTFYVKNLTIGRDVHAFEVTGVFGAVALDSVTVNPKNEYYKSEDGVLYDKDVTVVIYYPTAKEGSYTLPSTVTAIGARVFQSRTGITNITFSKTVTSIGEDAFYGCTKLETITFEDGGTETLTLGKEAFRGCSAVTSVTLPNRIAEISNGCFYRCSALQNIVIPDSVTIIGDEAFRNCSKLETITLPKNLTTLVEAKTSTDTSARTHAFDYCTSLTDIILAEENTNYKAVNGLLYKVVKENDYTGLNLIICPQGKTGDIEVADNLVEVSTNAFYNGKKLTSITFKDNLEHAIVFNTYSFYECDILTEVILPKGTTILPDNTFYSCDKLDTVFVPNTVTSISARALSYCYKLTNLTFEEGGTEALVIGAGTQSGSSSSSSTIGMFYNNHVIKTLVLPERTTKIDKYAFASSASGSGYSGNYGCSLENVTLPSTLTEIGDHAFDGCTIKNLTFASEVNGLKIGTYAFYKLQCETLTLPAGISTLGTVCFGYSTSLKTVTIPEGLEAIPSSCFSSCSKLEQISIPASVTSIGSSAFTSCSSLKKVIFAEGSKLETIDNNAFYSCKSLKTITIPQSVSNIKYNAFQACSSLDEVIFEGSDTEQGAGLRELGYQVFAGTALKEFRFPYCGKDDKGVYNKIKFNATSTTFNLFAGCKYLTDVYLSEAVTSVDKLFTKCSSLKRVTVAEGNQNFKVSDTAPVILNLDGSAIQFVFGRISDITIPDGVTSIGSYAFAGQTDITSITLPKTLKTIGAYAFNNCVNLKTVTFETGSVLDSISNEAFFNCSSLTKIVLPNTVTTIGKEAFEGCINLSEVTLSNSLTSIGQSAFMLCYSLESITLPNTLKTIGQYAFRFTGLKSIVIPENVTEIGQESFEDNDYLTTVEINTKKATFKNYIFRRCPSLKNVTLPEGIVTLGQGMFDTTGIEEITLPSTLTYLPTYVFQYCTELRSITIPAGVKLFGATSATGSVTATTTSYMFRGCTALEEVIFEEGSVFEKMGGYAFAECSSLKSINLPETLKIIGNYSFLSAGIESIVIPNSVTELGSAAGTGYTFQKCKSLKTVTLSSNLTKIYGYVFDGCSALEEVVIPSKVTILGNYVFSNCESLKKVDIQGKLATIGTYVFANDSALEEVTMLSTITLTGSYMFNNCTALKTITLPTALKTLGTYVFDGCTSLETIEIPATVTTIPNYAFRNCKSLTSVVAKGKLTAVNTYAFYDCENLANVDFTAAAATLKTIGTYVFYGCKSLTSIDLPVATSVANYAFYGCTKLASVNVPKATSVGSYAFRSCAALKTIDLPSATSLGIGAFEYTGLQSFNISNKITTINGGAFNTLYNLSLSSDSSQFIVYDDMAVINTKDMSIVSVFNIGDDAEIVVPESVLKLGTYCFMDTKNLKKITLPETITDISNYSFYNCANLEEVVLGSKVTRIGTEAFRKCASLTSIDFPDTVTMILNLAFAETSLKEVIMPEGVTQFNTAFKGITTLETVYVPSTITTFTASCFADCTSLKNVTLADGLINLSSNMFENCTSLESIVVPASVSEKITSASTATNTFKNCTALKNVTLSEGITIIPNYMFVGCTALETIELPSTINNIGTFAFSNTGLKEFVIPESVVTIGASAFRANAELTKATLNSTATSIGGYLFAECPKLAEVTVPEGQTFANAAMTSSTGNYMFYMDESLVKFTFPSTALFVPYHMFDGCANLEEVEINEGNTKVEYLAFLNCSKLSKVSLPSTVTYLAYGAFANCTSIKSIVISAECQLQITSGSLGNTPFDGWTEEQTVYVKASIFDVTGFWGEVTSTSGYFRYFSKNDAVFVFDYVEPENQSGSQE